MVTSEQPKMNRAQRRAAMKEFKRDKSNQITWEDLNSVYNNCLQIIAVTASIAEPVQMALEWIDNPDEVRVLVGQLEKDCSVLLDELSTIREMHKEKAGRPGVDDVMDVFGIYEAYNTWQCRQEGIVEPIRAELENIIAKAAQAKEAAEKANQPQQEGTENV